MEIKQKKIFQHIDEFRFIKDVGIGSFGKVKLATHRGTNKKYAIKIINLNQALTDLQLQILMREINIHIRLDHPHVIKLWDVFRDQSKIYMVMEYAANGSLFKFYTRIIKDKVDISSVDVYKYFFQTVQALKYLHSQDIMHRDIKPENILLDGDYNIKICDFGWATNQIKCLRNTFCGTFEYMAPEMIQEKNYDYRVDIWALGILLFQLFHGTAPFLGKSLQQMKKSFQSPLQIDEGCCEDVTKLMTKILQFDPLKRPQLEQIQIDPWIKKCQKILDRDSFLEQKTFLNNKDCEQERRKKSFLTPNNFETLIDPYLIKNSKKLESPYFRSRGEKNKENLSNFNFNSIYTEVKKKSTERQKEIAKKKKKKCKTQGEEEFSLIEVQTQRQVSQKKVNFEAWEEEEPKNPFQNKHELRRKDKQKILVKKKSFYQKDKTDKNAPQKQNPKLRKIEEKLNQLSSKFMLDKMKKKFFL